MGTISELNDEIVYYDRIQFLISLNNNFINVLNYFEISV